jgi:hypothetical protein
VILHSAVIWRKTWEQPGRGGALASRGDDADAVASPARYWGRVDTSGGWTRRREQRRRRVWGKRIRHPPWLLSRAEFSKASSSSSPFVLPLHPNSG